MTDKLFPISFKQVVILHTQQAIYGNLKRWVDPFSRVYALFNKGVLKLASRTETDCT